MIICEGPDGGGKTTLAKAIAEAYELEYMRPPPELLSSTTGPGTGLHEWWVEQLRLPEKEHRRKVYDRCFFISEAIYQLAQVDRDLIVGGHEIWRGIADLWTVGPVVIFCQPPMEVQYSNVIQDGRESLAGLNNRHLEKINFMYWAHYALWQNALFAQVVQYDYTRDSINWILDWVGERRQSG
jgi:hypothetical protein